MYKFLQSKKGFTIVELVCVLLLLSFGALALANLFSEAYRAFNKTEERYVKQETVKAVAEYLQKGAGGASLSAASKVEIYNTTKNVVPTGSTVDDRFNYIYVDPSDGFLYIRPANENKSTQLTTEQLYISFDVIPGHDTQVDESAGVTAKHRSRGVNCNIAAVDSEYSYEDSYDETTGTLTPPDSDVVYYDLDVAYHFANMVENDTLYVNQVQVGATGYQRANIRYKINGAEQPPIETVDDDGIVVKFISDITLSGEKLLTDAVANAYCFIATASYGGNSGEVGLLCDFRDNVLLTNPLGEAFVKAYYKLSPPVAEIIAESEPLRAAVRVALKPLIVVAVNALDEDVAHQSAPWFAAFMLCGAGSVAMIIRISKGRKKAKAK